MRKLIILLQQFCWRGGQNENDEDDTDIDSVSIEACYHHAVRKDNRPSL